LPTAQRCSRLSQKGGVYGPSDLPRGGRRIGTFSCVPRRPYLRRLARCSTVSRGGAAHRPETPRHYTQETGPARTRVATRYPGTCRTDRCRWAATCSPAGAFGQATVPATKAGRLHNRSTCAHQPVSIRGASHRSRAWARHQGCRSGDRAAALRPPDLVRITRAFNPRHARHSLSSGGAVEQFRQLGFNDADACELAASEGEPGRARYLLGSGCPPIRQPSQRRACDHSIKPDLAG
jgi:hypothetical protein